jgi:dTDP-4-dehydrorhamnose 3,5-epimerase
VDSQVHAFSRPRVATRINAGAEASSRKDGTIMIDGVAIKNLDSVSDERGHLIQLLAADDEVFEKFGRVFLSTTFPGVVEGWHLHRLQDDNLTCVRGMIKLVMYDGRRSSPTRGEVMEVFLGENKPLLVHIPREVHHGWKCISGHDAYVIVVANELYNPEEPDRYGLPYDTDEIPYDWTIKMG